MKAVGTRQLAIGPRRHVCRSGEEGGRPTADCLLPTARSWIEPGLFDSKPAGPWPFAGLEPMAYGLIMADPPWRFENYSEKGQAKGPEAHYETMTLDEIAALPVADLARPDCVLWLWATAPLLDRQAEILKGWGFTFKSAGAWNKRRWGTGYVWRSVAEFILIGTRGTPRIEGGAVPNLIEGGAAGHSRKPDKAYAQAEHMVPDARRRCSLFERPVRPGWDGWGKEYGREPIKPTKRRSGVSAPEAPAREGALL